MSKEVQFDESLMPEEEPERLADIQLDERHTRYALQRWPDKSQAMRDYRVRQAIWARLQHRKPHPDDPNRSLLGGPQPNSGRKKDPLGKVIVAHFEERQKEVLDAIAAPLAKNSDATDMDRHRAGMNIVKHAREEAREERDADEYARATDDEIRHQFAEMMADKIRTGEISMEDIIEGKATEIDDDDDGPKQLIT